MNTLVALALGLCLLAGPASAQKPKVHKDCVDLSIYHNDTFPIGRDLASNFRRELDRRLFWSNTYISSTRDVWPALDVEITMERIDTEDQEGEGSPAKAVFSAAYVLFPNSIRYHAYSTCGLLDRESLKTMVEKLAIEIRSVLQSQYPKAEDLKKIYDAHIEAEEEKLERLKKKGDSE